MFFVSIWQFFVIRFSRFRLQSSGNTAARVSGCFSDKLRFQLSSVNFLHQKRVFLYSLKLLSLCLAHQKHVSRVPIIFINEIS